MQHSHSRNVPHLQPRPRPRIMGILNCTPDSFSDGGSYIDEDRALYHALRLSGDGADIIDIGGESTRPGAQRVPAREQLERVLPSIKRIHDVLGHMQSPAILSIDTTLGQVAEPAIDAGVRMLNDVSGGTDERSNPAMITLAAQYQLPIVLMHMKGQPATMQNEPVYEDVVAEVEAFLLARAKIALETGVPREKIYLDPGIGFGKTTRHNLALLANLGRLVSHGFPVLLGTSRKRFLNDFCGASSAQPLSPELLANATAATTAMGVRDGVAVFRVHDVRVNRQAADIAWAISEPQP